MRVLIVEDDENKRHHIVTYIRHLIRGAVVDEARSYHSGLKRVLAAAHDVVLLDMSMPTFDIALGEDGGRPQPLGGREIMRQMDRRGVVEPVIVVTQLVRFGADETLTASELDAELSRDHARTYRGMVYYDASLAGWKDELRTLLTAVIGPPPRSKEET